MKKQLQFALLGVLAIAIGYQVYVFAAPKQNDRPILPPIPLTLLDQTSITLAYKGSDKHTIVFLMRSNCDYCKKETEEVRKHLDDFKDTEVLFLSFEELDVIAGYRQSMLPEERPYVTFAKVNQEDVAPFLEKDLAFPYMLWYDNNGVQKAQHRGVFPIERVLEVIAASEERNGG